MSSSSSVQSTPQELYSSSTTYEATKAQERNASQADKIHWERDAAYRNQAYRQLHHQNGLMGKFQVRLLEAVDLKRSYWSALALGPVKLLGLSKAHGEVSSFVSVSLTSKSSAQCTSMSPETKLPPPPPPKSTFASPVIPQNDNPVWTNCQFDIPLGKGRFNDGEPIFLQLRVDEDVTAVEYLIPTAQDRLLGFGFLDMTSLCLGQQTFSGQAQVGVLDTWVPITMPEKGKAQSDEQKNEQDTLKKPASTNNGNNNNVVGRVRVLVSYQPFGMEPQAKDIVALEAFARPNPKTATCRPIFPPLLPLHVVDTSGPWLLVEYQLKKNNHYFPHRDSNNNQNKACLRVHRNTVFVIERKNLMDETLNLALLPADIFMRSPVGYAAKDALGPTFVAGRQLMMPMLLSTKLLWMAVRTTGVAGLTGVNAVVSTMWNEGSSSLTQREGEQQSSRRMAMEGSTYTFV